jgi:predicted dehydrogenase
VIRVALYGYGYWGPHLARNIAATEGLTLNWILDSQYESRNRAITQHRVQTAFAYDDLPDASVICTPISTHYELARAELLAGRHVMVAKPLAASVEQAEELAAIAHERGLVLLTDHTFIYTPAVERLKALYDAGTLGRLLYLDSVRVNLGLFQQDADVLWDLAAHDVSIFNHLVGGLPDAVSALGSDPLERGFASGVHLHLWYGSLQAHAHLSWLSPLKVRRMLIAGSEKMVLYDDTEPSEKLRVYDSGAMPREGALVDYRSGDVLIPKLPLAEALAVECAHFAACIRGETEPLTGPVAGVGVVRVLEAASASLELGGQRVDV